MSDSYPSSIYYTCPLRWKTLEPTYKYCRQVCQLTSKYNTYSTNNYDISKAFLRKIL